jgi:hypothetical protein
MDKFYRYFPDAETANAALYQTGQAATIFNNEFFDAAPAPSGNTFFIKIAGAWKQATGFVKVAGSWKPFSPKIKIGGQWM